MNLERMAAIRSSQAKRVLILVSKKPRDAAQPHWSGLVTKLPDMLDESISLTVGSLDMLVFDIGKNSSIYHIDDGYDISDFDLVIFRMVGKRYENAIAAAHYLVLKEVPFIDSYLQTHGNGKLASASLRSSLGLPVPRTIYTSSSNFLRLFKSNAPLKFPFIVKADMARKGNDNYLVHDKTELNEVIKDCIERNVDVIAQEYIKSDGDYRMLVLGGHVRFVLQRKIVGNTHLSNTSKGGSAEVVAPETINVQIISDAIAAAKHEQLEVAGVDIIISSQTGKHYILEANRAPQIPTGAYSDLKLKCYADYISEQIRKLT